MLKPGALALFMAADRVAAAKDGRVALASKITADRILPDIGFGIAIDLHIAPYLAESCEALELSSQVKLPPIWAVS